MTGQQPCRQRTAPEDSRRAAFRDGVASCHLSSSDGHRDASHGPHSPSLVSSRARPSQSAAAGVVSGPQGRLRVCDGSAGEGFDADPPDCLSSLRTLEAAQVGDAAPRPDSRGRSRRRARRRRPQVTALTMSIARSGGDAPAGGSDPRGPLRLAGVPRDRVTRHFAPASRSLETAPAGP